MTPVWRHLTTIVAGVAIGVGGAALLLRTQALGADTALGPWTTGGNFGSADAGALTRAVVAMKGLLALPASEARYYTATTDSDGQALDGRCRYRVTGNALPARWWSLTLYDADNYLVRNSAGIFSVASPALPETGWQVIVAPSREGAHWLPTGGVDRFDLTLRTYLPAGGLPPAAAMPRIERLGCAS